MSLETVSERRRKRIVEHIVGPFDNAYEAIRFGNTVESLVNQRFGEVKFRQQIGSPDTRLAITEDYIGPTMLKTMFLELADQDMALYVSKTMEVARQNHNEHNNGRVEQIDEVIREKPQPQFIGK